MKGRGRSYEGEGGGIMKGRGGGVVKGRGEEL